MAGYLMVMNPMAKRKKHKKRKARRKLTAKQIAAGFGGKRRTKKRRAKAAGIVVKENPTRGSKMAKKRRRHKHRRKFLSNPKRRRFRRNPIERGFTAATIKPAAIGAVGAMASQWLQSMVPLFPNAQGTILGPVVSIGYSLVVGYGVEAVAGAPAGEQAAAGGIMFALYDFFQQITGGGGLFGLGGQSQQMSRYLGYLRANPRLLQAVNQRRQLRGLQPINMQPRFGLAGGRPVGVRPMNGRFGLGATSPNVASRQRFQRGGLGWISPARNLSRYVR